MPRKFSSKYFNEGESRGRMQATFRRKFREIDGLISQISDFPEIIEEFTNPETYASYVVSELLNFTVTDKDGEFFDSENRKDEFLESLLPSAKDALLAFVAKADNQTYFENSEDSHIQNLCGDFYRCGFGFEKDDNKAFEKYSAAAVEDYYPALENLVECYDEGIGVKLIDAAKIEEIRKKIVEKDYHIVSVSSAGEEELDHDSKIGSLVFVEDDATVISDITGSLPPSPISRPLSAEKLNERKLDISRRSPHTI